MESRLNEKISLKFLQRKYGKNNQGVVDDVVYSILPEEL